MESVTSLTYSPKMTNALIDIQAVLKKLAKTRPMFHSERDLQFAFAWTVAQMYPSLKVRLEVGQPNGERLDLLVADKASENKLAIEFKHLTSAWNGQLGGETYIHGKPLAYNLGRRGIIRDLERVESFKKSGASTSGAVITISNLPAYWNPAKRYSGSINYQVHQGAILKGKLIWHPNNLNSGWRHITLNNKYQATWNPYSDPAGGPGPFKSLVFETP
jgi:hypothetical protein